MNDPALKALYMGAMPTVDLLAFRQITDANKICLYNKIQFDQLQCENNTPMERGLLNSRLGFRSVFIGILKN